MRLLGTVYLAPESRIGFRSKSFKNTAKPYCFYSFIDTFLVQHWLKCPETADFNLTNGQCLFSCLKTLVRDGLFNKTKIKATFCSWKYEEESERVNNKDLFMKLQITSIISSGGWGGVFLITILTKIAASSPETVTGG